MHGRDPRLAGFALTDAVGARLGQQQRLLPGNVLQPRDVGAQIAFAVQVHVEGADVKK